MALVVDCPHAPPVYVDRAMWEKIVLDLLSNALKFTLRGEIRARLEVRETEAVLSVADNGEGVPTDELARVFERFHRVGGSSGLGPG